MIRSSALASASLGVVVFAVATSVGRPLLALAFGNATPTQAASLMDLVESHAWEIIIGIGSAAVSFFLLRAKVLANTTTISTLATREALHSLEQVMGARQEAIRTEVGHLRDTIQDHRATVSAAVEEVRHLARSVGDQTAENKILAERVEGLSSAVRNQRRRE